MASKQQIIHIITEIAVLASITAYFLYRNKVLNEKMKSLEYKIFQQEELIKKHDIILQSLLSSSSSFSKTDNKPSAVLLKNNNVSTFFNNDTAAAHDTDDDTDTDDDDDDGGGNNNNNDDDDKSHNIYLQNNNNNFKQNVIPDIGKVVISIGEIPLPNFAMLQPTSQDDELSSSKVEEIFDKDVTLQNQEIDEIDDVSSSDTNSNKRKKKKKKNKKKNLTEDELLDLEILNEIQELA